MFKKGQAAMEFLMTYGWAILVVLIALGALFYLGVFNPKTGNSYQVTAPFSAQDLKVDTTGVQLKVGGSGITTATLTAMNVNGGSCTNIALDDELLSTSITNNLGGNITLGTIIKCNTTALTVSDKVIGTVDVTYAMAGGIDHTTEWTFSGTVE